MNTVLGLVGGLVVGAGLGYGASVFYKNAHSGSGDSNNPVVMELDGVKYHESDLPAETRSSIYEARMEDFKHVNNILNEVALQIAMAKDKDKNAKMDALPSFDQLIDVPAPSDAEMKAIYDKNKDRLPPGTEFEKIKPDLEKYVKNQKVGEVLRAKNEEFRTKNRLKLTAEAPMAPRVTLVLDDYPAMGPKAAPHTLVEVADYLCPHCQAAQPEVEALLKDLGDKVRFVPATYALHPETLSGTLARGAYCAKQQGDEAFWKWHTTAFATGKTKGWKAGDPDSKDSALEVAQAAGLDKGKLSECLDSPGAKDFLAKSIAAMHRAGVSGTPTFFLDGRKLATAGGESLKESIVSGMQGASH